MAKRLKKIRTTHSGDKYVLPSNIQMGLLNRKVADVKIFAIDITMQEKLLPW